jgi:hypothetical protein
MSVRTQSLQTSFASGVLNPAFAARTDIEHYYQGARRGLNVIFPKEGGALGRWGLPYLADLLGDGRLIKFEFNTEQIYLLWFGELKLQVFRDDALVTNINGTGLDYLVTPWTLAQVKTLDYTQSADTLVIAEADVENRRLVRGTAHNLWTLSTLPLVNVPKFDFNDADSPTPTSHVVDITFTAFVDGDRYKLQLNDFETPEIHYSSVSTDANERRIKDELLLLPPTGFDDTSITVAFTSGTTYRLTYSGESADAYEPMTGRNTDTVAASIGTSTINPGAPRREVVISATRGWPRAVMFYENRLWLGGLKQLPQALLGTVIGGFFDLNVGTGLDDQGVFITVNTDQVNEIRALYPGRHFQMFTSGGEFYSPDRPMTPAPGLPRQSRFGSASGIKPVEVDGATIFVTGERKTIREYLFLWSEEAYNATSLTVMASHLFNQIQSLAALTSTDDAEDSYVLTTNGPKGLIKPETQPEDGSGAILNTLRSQDIAAWSEMVTRSGDKLKNVEVAGTDIYYLVERARNGSTVYQLEKASFTTRMDSSKEVTSGLGTTTPGFAHLANETVQVMVDGAPVADQLVSVGGELTFEVAPSSSVEAGYFVPPILETMPLVADIGLGPMLGERKRIVEIRVQVQDTLGLVANGRLIPDKIPGSTSTSTPDTPFAGLRKIGELGWTHADSTITLTQQQPLPFHILAVSGVMEVSRT